MSEHARSARSGQARNAAGARADYAAFKPVLTRWTDNDVYGHVNNALYYVFFDTAVTVWQVERGLIGILDGPMWVVAETGCRFIGEIAFPDELSVGIRVAHIGVSSVRFELAIFRQGAERAAAEGHFVHVHLDRATRRPCPIPEATRAALATLQMAATQP